METPKPPESDPETTTGGWLLRTAENVADVLSLRIHAWSEMPGSLDYKNVGTVPVAAMVGPRDFVLCDRPEDGYKRREA